MFRRLMGRLVNRLATDLGVLIYQQNLTIAQKTLPEFGNEPNDLVIELPRRIVNAKCIFLGDHVWIGPGSFLNALTHYYTSPQHPERQREFEEFSPKIIIGHRVNCTGNLVIGAVKEVVVEDDVLLASNVAILDHMHGYESPYEPYVYQKLWRIAPVLIKRGCWIGQNVVVLPGVTIGELSIIGANSVVTENIPARCIAVGAPARVTRKWDEASQRWTASSAK